MPPNWSSTPTGTACTASSRRLGSGPSIGLPASGWDQMSSLRRIHIKMNQPQMGGR